MNTQIKDIGMRLASLRDDFPMRFNDSLSFRQIFSTPTIDKEPINSILWLSSHSSIGCFH